VPAVLQALGDLAMEFLERLALVVNRDDDRQQRQGSAPLRGGFSGWQPN
jgi:hypothetical protein